MAKRRPLAIKRDDEEIFNISYCEENSSTLSNELEGVEKLELVFLPPSNGKDSDKDDAQVILKKDLPISKTLEEVYYLNLLK